MEFSFREIVLFAHIASGAVLVGTSVISPFIGRRIRSASSRTSLLAWAESLGLVTRANPLFAMILLASGIQLGAAGWWSQGWFSVSIAAWLASSALAGGVVKPALARIAAEAASNPDSPIDPALDQMRHSRGWSMAEHGLLASDLAILWIMVVKPDLTPSILILTLTMAAFAGLTFLPRSSVPTS